MTLTSFCFSVQERCSREPSYESELFHNELGTAWRWWRHSSAAPAPRSSAATRRTSAALAPAERHRISSRTSSAASWSLCSSRVAICSVIVFDFWYFDSSGFSFVNVHCDVMQLLQISFIGFLICLTNNIYYLFIIFILYFIYYICIFNIYLFTLVWCCSLYFI